MSVRFRFAFFISVMLLQACGGAGGEGEGGAASDPAIPAFNIASHSNGFSIDKAYLRLTGTCEAGAVLQVTADNGARVTEASCSVSGDLRVTIKLIGPPGNRTVTVAQSTAAGLSAAITLSGTLTAPVLDVGMGRDYASIHDAVAVASSGDIIGIDPGIYVETDQLVLNKNLTPEGHKASDTVFKLGNDLTDRATDAHSWFLSTQAAHIYIGHMTLDGNGKVVRTAMRLHGTGIVENCFIKDIYNRATSPADRGLGIHVFNNMVVRNNVLSQVQRVAIWIDTPAGGEAGTAVIEDNTYVGRGTGSGHDEHFVTAASGATVQVRRNKTENMLLMPPSGYASGTAVFLIDANATITQNEFGSMSPTGTGIVVYHTTAATRTVVIQNNSFAGSWPADRYAMQILTTNLVADARFNWFGDVSGPYDASGNLSGTGARLYVAPGAALNYSDWLVSPSQLGWSTAGYRAPY